MVWCSAGREYFWVCSSDHQACSRQEGAARLALLSATWRHKWKQHIAEPGTARGGDLAAPRLLLNKVRCSPNERGRLIARSSRISVSSALSAAITGRRMAQ